MERRYWLLKSDPDTFGWTHLEGSPKGRTVWDGVRNYQARNTLRDEVQKGDGVLFYHSGNERAVVGIVKAVSDPYPDPEDRSGKYVAVDVEPVTRLPRPVTLAEIKADGAFTDFPLVRIARLSVMPVTDAQWARIERMARAAPRGEP